MRTKVVVATLVGVFVAAVATAQESQLQLGAGALRQFGQGRGV